MPPQRLAVGTVVDESQTLPVGTVVDERDVQPAGGGRGAGGGPRTGAGGGRPTGQSIASTERTPPPLGQLAKDLVVGGGKGLGRAVIDLGGMLVSQPSGGLHRSPEFDAENWPSLQPENTTQKIGGLFGEAAPTIAPGIALSRQANLARRVSGGLLRSAIPELTEEGAEFLGSRGIGRITATNRARTLDVLQGQQAANAARAEAQTAALQNTANQRHAAEVQRLNAAHEAEVRAARQAHAARVTQAEREAADAAPRSAQEILGTNWPPQWSGGPAPTPRPTPRAVPPLELPARPTLPPAPQVTPVTPDPVDWNPAVGMREAMDRRTSTMGRLASLGSTLAATGGGAYLWKDHPELALALMVGRGVTTPGARATLAHGLRRFSPTADTIGGTVAGVGANEFQQALLRALGVGGGQ